MDFPSNDVDVVHEVRNARDGNAGHPYAQDAPGEAEHHDLEHVDRHDLAARGAGTFQHRDAVHLLQHEDARHARHGNAAQDDDDQADHAEVVLRPIEVAADFIVRRTVRAGVDELFLEVRPQSPDKWLYLWIGHPDLEDVAGAAPKGQEPGGGKVGGIDEDARAQAEIANLTAGLVSNDATDGERPLCRWRSVADGNAESGQQFGRTSTPRLLSIAWA